MLVSTNSLCCVSSDSAGLVNIIFLHIGVHKVPFLLNGVLPSNKNKEFLFLF